MKITVRTKQAVFDVPCDPGERILYAALRAGVPVPFECASGTCGTCKARTRSGAVNELWLQAPGRSYLKPERGEFLMCQCEVRSDCEILVPGMAQEARSEAARPQHLRGTLRRAQKLTHDVAGFSIELERPISYQAGQFVVIEVPGVPGYRAYSMVNFEPDARALDFVVKKNPGGGFSHWLFEENHDPTPVRLFGPLGRATFLPAEDKDILCIAGGSGIAGMMAILAAATRADYFRTHRGHVFFGVRTMRDLFYLEELRVFVAASGGNLSVTVALSDEEVERGVSAHGVRFATGFVHLVAAQEMANQFEGLIAYVAGPPPMVDGALRMLILEGRLPAADIRYDKFG